MQESQADIIAGWIDRRHGRAWGAIPTPQNIYRGDGLHDHMLRGRTDRFGVLDLDDERYLVPESWQWAIRMAPGQAVPATIPTRPLPVSLAIGRRHMAHIRRRMAELGEPRQRDARGRFKARR